MSHYFKPEDGVSTFDIDGNQVKVTKGMIIVTSIGVVGKVLGVTKTASYFGKAMLYYPFGDDTTKAHCSYPSGLQHSAVLVIQAT